MTITPPLFYNLLNLLHPLLKLQKEGSIKREKNLKVMVGAGGKKQKGFISTDIKLLNITKASDWASLFVTKRAVFL